MSEEPSAPPEAARRVLVTGFHDWPSPSDPPGTFDPQQCRVNPSGRLLLGPPYAGGAPPTRFDGPLCAILPAEARARRLPLSFRFATLPVTWGIADTLDLSAVDVVVSLGLGVYPPEPATRLLLERGAWNGRLAAPDAAGRGAGSGELPTRIAPEAGPVLAPSPELAARIEALDLAHCAAYEVRVVEARASNAFLCNETHYRLLQAEQGAAGPSVVAFVHLAAPLREDDYPALAEAVAELVLRLAAP